jgi:hypothetical protein
MQRTRAQLPISRIERALIGGVLDTTEQVFVRRVWLEDHRRTAAGRMTDHQTRRVLLFQQLAGNGVGLAVVDQLLDHGFQQVHLHRLQITANGGVLGVLLRERREQWLQGQGDGFFVERTQLVVRLTFPLRQAGEFFVQPLFKTRDVLVETLTIDFRQLGEFGFVQRLAIEHRREGDVAAVAIQGDVFFQCQTLDDVEGLVVTLVEGAVDGAFLLLVGGVFEDRRESRQQVVDQTVDITDERTGGARWQFQCARFTRLIEIIDVHPVRRCLQAFAFGFQVAFDERKATGAGLAHDKYVVTGARHGHAELQGFDRTFLAEHTAKGLQIIGGSEAETVQRKTDGSALRALDASWQQQDQASGFLTSGGADSGILAPPVPHWQGAPQDKA